MGGVARLANSGYLTDGAVKIGACPVALAWGAATLSLVALPQSIGVGRSQSQPQTRRLLDADLRSWALCGPDDLRGERVAAKRHCFLREAEVALRRHPGTGVFDKKDGLREGEWVSVRACRKTFLGLCCGPRALKGSYQLSQKCPNQGVRRAGGKDDRADDDNLYMRRAPEDRPPTDRGSLHRRQSAPRASSGTEHE